MVARIPALATLVELWDSAREQHPIDRALTMIGSFTGADRAEVATLSIERRDALLLEIRRTFCGDRIAAMCTCVTCGGTNEFGFDASELPSAPDVAVLQLTLHERTVTVRIPTSYDLAALASESDPEVAADKLFARCVECDEPLDAAARAEIERLLEVRAGITSMSVRFACVHCDARNAVPFDIASYVWDELCERVRGLLADVDVLASAYGWSEAAIFALGDRRRAVYAGMARA